MDNKRKLLNEAEGEISLALIGIIMKKIKKVAFQVVYEKLLKDGDDRANKFFKNDLENTKFVIKNYEDLLNLEIVDNNKRPDADIIVMNEKADQEQIRKLTSNKPGGLGKEAYTKLQKVTKTDDKDNSFFTSLKDTFKRFFGLDDSDSESKAPQNLSDEQRKKFKDLIYKYDPFKNTVNTHIFPHTAVEEYFVKKRTGLEKTYDISEVTKYIKRSALVFHELKKIRLTILKVQKASRELKGQKIKDDDKVKTISDIVGTLAEQEQDVASIQSQTDISQTDRLIRSFVAGKGKIGLNPFAIADELLYSIYGETKLKKFMKQAEELHDELNEISKYVVKVLKSRKLDTSGDEEGDVEKLGEKTGIEPIESAKNIYKQKIENKYKFKDKQGKDVDVSKKVLNVLDILAKALIGKREEEETPDTSNTPENEEESQ